MVQGDWSSDVCSSDLQPRKPAPRAGVRDAQNDDDGRADQAGARVGAENRKPRRATKWEERRVGNEWRTGKARAHRKSAERLRIGDREEKRRRDAECAE